ncbi:hypothetical protein FM120_15880 [Sphingobacterium faecium PCAi_F2.5]|nr:hypothetical protein FM120_15880 [Sphingobacterium faecium PCAi_F2.5]
MPCINVEILAAGIRPLIKGNFYRKPCNSNKKGIKMKNGTICLPMAPFVVFVVLSGQFSNHFLDDLKKLASCDEL